jgi:Uma2 family endonuclease
MKSRTKLPYVSEEDYLAAEEKATIRHEYVDGAVFAMSGSTDAHNSISGNIFAFIHSRLRGGPCRAYINDMKVRIQVAKSYYYPDVMVSCEGYDAKSVSKSNPVLLVEVLSRSTAQIDRREKLIAYKKIPSLSEYVIVYQDRQQIELYRRVIDGWELLVLRGDDDEVVLESLPDGPLNIPISTIYEGCDPPAIVKESETEYGLDFETVDY